ncbi:MAG: CapA family protein [Clostridia bacterium]|nr:CapA family protein [Clostridia bacterium]
MKKIYLIAPLVVILVIIGITAIKVINTQDPSTQIADDITEALGSEAVETISDTVEYKGEIDMSSYMESVGLPVPSGSHGDLSAEVLGKSEADNGTKLEYSTEKLSFLAVGDNLIHSSVFSDALEIGGGEKYIFDSMYENVAEPIRNADLSFINQESPIAGEEFAPSNYPMFNTPVEMGDTLLGLGFDIISIANNHMLDKFEKGYRNHIDFWSSKPVTLIGGYRNSEDYENIRVVEKNGISIALLAYTYGTNGMSLPNGSEMVIPLINEKTIVRHITAAKKKADVVMVSIHWGDEGTFTPNQQQRRLAQLMADNCVDVVLGHHSHTIQPIEWYERPDGKKTLVAFSLSNFMSAQEKPMNMLAGMLTFDLEQISDADTVVTNVLFTPTVTYYNNSWRGFKLYFLKDYTQELHSSARCSKFEPDSSYYTNTVKKVIDSDFLPEYFK